MSEDKQLTIQERGFSLSPTSLKEAMELSEIMANSEMVPKDFQGKPGNVLVAVQMGLEIGLPPTQALQNIAVINGRPAIWGDAALAIVRGHPRFESISETLDDQAMVATCTIKRKGEQPHTVTFSRADAEFAGLWTKPGPWKQYPKRMLQMRARSFAIRDVFPDALKGIYVAEEAQDIPSERDMGQAEVVGRGKTPPVYSDEEFDSLFPEWEHIVTTWQKTPEALIAFVGSKKELTEAQREKILNIEVEAPGAFDVFALKLEPMVRSGKKSAEFATRLAKTMLELTEDQELQIDAWEQEGEDGNA